MKLTLTYQDEEYEDFGGKKEFTFDREEPTATSVINWLTGVFEAIDFGAVSVRINAEYSESHYTPMDMEVRDTIRKLKDADAFGAPEDSEYEVIMRRAV